MAAPTTRDAQRVAEQLAAAGASRVLLFGSVARGDAGPGSDIDLVAVFDDIDYSQRLALESQLAAVAYAVVGHRVAVHVTDWPEWRHRAEVVSASFEAAIAEDAMVLFDRAPRSVQWGKEIGLPEDNAKEALQRVVPLAGALERMLTGIRSDRVSEAAASGQWERVETRRQQQMTRLCQDGALAVETALKALVALSGGVPRRTHWVHELLEQEFGQYREQVSALLAQVKTVTLGLKAVDYSDVSMWRGEGTYPEREMDAAAVSRLVPRIVAAAMGLTELLLVELEAAVGDDRRIADARDTVVGISESLREREVVSGRALHDGDVDRKLDSLEDEGGLAWEL